MYLNDWFYSDLIGCLEEKHLSNIGVKDRDPGSWIRVLESSGMICGYSSMQILITALLYMVALFLKLDFWVFGMVGSDFSNSFHSY